MYISKGEIRQGDRLTLTMTGVVQSLLEEDRAVNILYNGEGEVATVITAKELSNADIWRCPVKLEVGETVYAGKQKLTIHSIHEGYAWCFGAHGSPGTWKLENLHREPPE
jgi:hypothetical protein